MATSKKKSSKTKKSGYTRFIIAFWALFIGGLLAIALLYAGIRNGIFGELPSPRELENPETPEASIVYSADGKVLGKYYRENRTPINYEDLGPNLENALVATEDIRFRQHAGIDFRGLARVVIKTVILQQDAGGGSTISQQLAKNLFHNQAQSLVERIQQKLKEWVIAVELEKNYTKDEIITMYFNTVNFGHNTYGIRSAAKTFFDKTPAELSVEEAATLVGVLKATTYYSPRSNYENSLNRRNVVLHQMMKYNFISEAEYDSLSELPIELQFKVESHNTGLATYFREHLRGEMKEWSEANGYDLYNDGLRIHTTINSRMQAHAEEAVREHLSKLQKQFFEHWEDRGKPWEGFEEQVIWSGIQRSDRYWRLKQQNPDITRKEVLEHFNTPVERIRMFSWDGEIVKENITPMDSVEYHKMFLHTGLMAMEPHSGHIQAWVGGIDQKYFQYDHVNKKAKRQVGSTFKPFVYLSGIVVNKFSPCLEVPNLPVTFEEYDNWTPENSGKEYGGMMSLKEGLANSVNTITAYVMKRVGPETVIQFARKMGITSELPPYPSIALGTPDISVYEMVGAYNTFANKGFFVEPLYITRIEDKNGNVLQEFVPRTVEVLDEGHNYVMLQLLQGVTQYGTGVRLRGPTYRMTEQIAGKTGTTDNNSDGWFIGVMPDLTAGVWVGAEDRAVHFRSTRLGQGANMALPIWALFVNMIKADPELEMEKTEFDVPETVPIETNCSRYENQLRREGESSDDFWDIN